VVWEYKKIKGDKMSNDDYLMNRANSKCELCSSSLDLQVYEVPPQDRSESILICQICLEQIDGRKELNANHWHCLSESMWSEYKPVQVVAWRVLKRLRDFGWAQDLFDQMYLEDDILTWAKGPEIEEEDNLTLDSNGKILNDGDKVTLIKNLDVKGANFTAKRGTIVKKIYLTGDPDLVEGRINGQQIVLKTCFLKKVQS